MSDKSDSSNSSSSGKPSGEPSEHRVHRYMSKDLSCRISVVNSGSVVESVRQIQHTNPIATVALGRTITGALLMASQLKENQEVALDFNMNGPLGRIYAHATFDGKVRGYASDPQLDWQPQQGLILSPYVDGGLLTVSSFKPQSALPYRGTVEVRSGEIAEDLAYYFQQSHQIPTLLSLGVHLTEYGMVDGAGGIIIQLMPGSDPKVIDQLEENLQDAPIVSEAFSQGASELDVAQAFTKGMEIIAIDHDHPIHYSCPCTKKRLLRSMKLLGLEEIKRSIEENESIESQCQMCGKAYHIEVQDLEMIMRDLQNENLH